MSWSCFACIRIRRLKIIVYFIKLVSFSKTILSSDTSAVKQKYIPLQLSGKIVWETNFKKKVFIHDPGGSPKFAANILRSQIILCCDALYLGHWARSVHGELRAWVQLRTVARLSRAWTLVGAAALVTQLSPEGANWGNWCSNLFTDIIIIPPAAV